MGKTSRWNLSCRFFSNCRRTTLESGNEKVLLLADNRPQTGQFGPREHCVLWYHSRFSRKLCFVTLRHYRWYYYAWRRWGTITINEVTTCQEVATWHREREIAVRAVDYCADCIKTLADSPQLNDSTGGIINNNNRRHLSAFHHGSSLFFALLEYLSCTNRMVYGMVIFVRVSYFGDLPTR